MHERVIMRAHTLLCSETSDLFPWCLLEQGVVAFDYHSPTRGFENNGVRDWIPNCMIKTGCSEPMFWLVAFCDGHLLQAPNKFNKPLGIERERGTSSPKCFVGIAEF